MAAAALFCAAAFAPGLTAYAQNLDEGTYEEKNGIAYRKSATLVNGTTDEYWIELEAFVTGEVTVVSEVKPADIVLVLDVSGSMDQTVINIARSDARVGDDYTNDSRSQYIPANSPAAKYLVAEENVYTRDKVMGGYYYYKHSDGNYYRVRTINSSTYGKFLVWKNKTSWYSAVTLPTPSSTQGYRFLHNVNGAGTSSTIMPAGVSSNSDAIYTGTLYRMQTKMELLKQASETFVDVVKNKNPENATVGHRIAIVTFSTGSKVNIGLTEVTSGFGDLQEEINNLHSFGETQVDSGMEKARELLDAVKTLDRSRFVVVFTDGAPTSSKDRALEYAKTIKATGNGAINGIVYSIGMIPPEEATDEVNKFMNYLSSNFPNASNMSNPGSGTMNGEYYIDALGGDLTDIFGQVAEHTSGVSGNTTVTGQSAVTVDVVTTSFNIPKTAGDTYDIQVLVAACNGQSDRINPKTGKNYLTFDEPVSPEAAGFSITLDPDSLANNKVVTKGFDYSDNFCAYNAEADPPARGYKQIIRFRIKANEDAVGGPNVTTNDQSSGIWIDDPDNPGKKMQIAEFNRPTVKVPVQIWIAKDGLVGDDNAIFTLYWAQPEERHYVPDPNNPERMVIDPTKFVKAEWHQFTKVTLNNNLQLKYNYNGKQIPLVKIPGLDPDYVYQIKEDAWSWSYEPVVRIMYTAGEEIHNPFVFVNQPRENLKEAESGIRNVFNEGTVTPDPSAPVAP